MADGAAGFPQDFSGPAVLRIPLKSILNFLYRTITFFGPSFQMCSNIKNISMSWSYNPNVAVTTLVWALSRSLATTWEITFVFSSFGYLDVSVHRVRLSIRK